MSWITGRPRWTIGILFLVTLALGRHARHKRIDNRLEENVLQNVELERYRTFLDEFGNDRILMGAFPFESLDADLLLGLHDLEERLMATGTVQRILSPLAILRDVFGLETREDMEAWLADERRIANYRERLEGFTVLNETIISLETRMAGLVLRIDDDVSDTDIHRILEVKRMMEEHPVGGRRMVVTGIPDIIRVIHEYTKESQRVFTPATLLLVIVVLLGLYRSAFGVLAPLSAVLVALIWTLGIFNLMGNTTNFITSMIPPLILGNGLTSCIHLVTTYFQRSRDLETFDPAVLNSTVRDLAPPILMCQITTMVGFASLAANGIGAIRQYGLYSALGILFLLISVFGLLPALITQFAITRQRITRLQTAHRFLEKVGTFVTQHPRAILLVVLAITALGASGMGRLSVETSLIRYIPRDHEIVKDLGVIEERLGGIVPVHLVMRRQSDELEGTLLDPDLCLAVARLKEELVGLEYVDRVISHVDFIQDYDRAFSGEPDNIPPTAEEVEEYLDFYRPYREPVIEERPIRDEEGKIVGIELVEKAPPGKGDPAPVDEFITRDYGLAHMAIRIRDVSSRELSEAYARILRAARKRLPPDVEVHLTGRAYLWAITSEIIVRNEMMNLLLALLMIDLVIIFHFRSLTVGILALLPNLFPLAFLYGILGYLGFAINTVTGMLACVAVGMSVDDTIHYIHAFRRHLASGSSYEEAVHGAIREKGSSMIFTTIVIMAGFSVLMLSSFVPTFQFGALISLTFMMALVLDLTLTPAMLLILRPFPEAPARGAPVGGVPETGGGGEDPA